MKRVIIITLLTAVPLLLSACNTIEGMGKDIQDGGRAMNKAINGDSSRDKEFQN